VTVNDDGSAVVESVMVMALLLALVAGVLQLGLALHIRNTATAAAAEGARTAARAGQSDGIGIERARRVLGQALPGASPATIQESRSTRAGLDIVEVQITMALPLIGPWGPSGGLTVRGRSVAEPQ
jgi:hypothetical protein